VPPACNYSTKVVVDFTDRDIKLIAASLPNLIDQRRLDLLPQILRDWGCTDLPMHLQQKPEPLERRQERFQRLALVEKQAKLLNEALAAIDHADKWGIIIKLACPPERYPKGLSAANIHRACQELESACEWLPRVVAAARDASLRYAPQKGPARNDVPYLVLLDLAALFKWLTGRIAARAWFKGGLEEEQPAFHAFAAAVWPVIFCSDDGLSNAMRTWNHGRRKHGDFSLLIINVALRHPTWGIFT
jgi:hypothetical protein